MEITNSLLVAMMFIVLLTMGIGNIVTALATMVDKRTPFKFDAIHTSWLILLLLLYFNLFWHTLDILNVEEWIFLEFLYIVSGPLLILFATNVLVPDLSSSSVGSLRDHYYGVARQFFFFLALQQAWIIGVDIMLHNDFSVMSGVNVATGLLFLVLASTQNEKVHIIGTLVAWVLFLGSAVLQGVGNGS